MNIHLYRYKYNNSILLNIYIYESKVYNRSIQNSQPTNDPVSTLLIPVFYPFVWLLRFSSKFIYYYTVRFILYITPKTKPQYL